MRITLLIGFLLLVATLVLSDYSDACLSDIYSKPQYMECIQDIPFTDLKKLISFCSTFKTDNCKKVFDNPIDIFPACKNDPIFVSVFNVNDPFMKKYNNEVYEHYCTFDENDQPCPDVVVAIEGGKATTDVIKNEVCQSKKCSDSYFEMASFIVDNYDQIQKYKFGVNGDGLDDKKKFLDNMELLKSEECKQKSGSPASGSSASGSPASFNIGTSLLFTFIGVLLLLL